MENSLTVHLSSPADHRFSQARRDPDAFLRWCRKTFSQRFGKDVFFVVLEDDSHAQNLADFMDAHLTEELRKTYGQSSLFFRELKSAMKTRSRKREIVDCRRIMMRLLKDSNITLTQIGSIMGGRDHTTVIHSLAKHDDLMKTEPAYRAMFNKLKQRCINEGFIFSVDSIKDYAQPALCTA